MRKFSESFSPITFYGKRSPGNVQHIVPSKKNAMVRLLILIFITMSVLASCYSKPEKGKRIQELIPDERLITLLERAIEENPQKDTIYSLIVHREKDEIHLPFYETQAIYHDRNYLGYFYCKEKLFLIYDVNKEDKHLELFKPKNSFRYFPSEKPKKIRDSTESIPYIYDPFYYLFVYKNDSLVYVSWIESDFGIDFEEPDKWKE